MNTVHPTGEQIKELRNAPDQGPVVMVNLLKFKEVTNAGETGRAAYERYGRNTFAILKSIGARVLWQGSVDQVFIGTERDKWDDILLVEYPSRKAFLEMISRPDYQHIHKDREDALVNSALIACQGVFGAVSNRD